MDARVPYKDGIVFAYQQCSMPSEPPVVLRQCTRYVCGCYTVMFRGQQGKCYVWTTGASLKRYIQTWIGWVHGRGNHRHGGAAVFQQQRYMHSLNWPISSAMFQTIESLFVRVYMGWWMGEWYPSDTLKRFKIHDSFLRFFRLPLSLSWERSAGHGLWSIALFAFLA